MAKQYNELSDTLISFIKNQKIFFVATATTDSRINVSPKGMDSFRVLNNNRVIWLNVTGSGNETAAHIQKTPRMTIMFTAFEGEPMILRLYGEATVVHMNDPEWDEIYSHFTPNIGARQVFDVAIDLVQTSCGIGVPFFDYAGEREMLNNWADKKGTAGIKAYWENKNQESLDGIPTNIMQKNT